MLIYQQATAQDEAQSYGWAHPPPLTIQIILILKPNDIFLQC